MNNMTKRMEAVEAALAKQSGETSIKVIIHEDGETSVQARERAGLTDWPGQVVCISSIDAKL